jgi:hypothetical protein
LKLNDLGSLRMKWSVCVTALLPLVASLRHVPLTGIPLQLSLEFLGQDKPNAPAALVTLSQEGILARLQPTTGDIVWRQRIEGAEAFHVVDDVVLARTNTTVNLFNAVSGFLLWTRTFPLVRAAYLKGNDTVILADDAVLILSRVDGSDGRRISAQGPLMLFDESEDLVATYQDGALLVDGHTFKSPSSIIPLPLLNKLVFLSNTNVLTLACPKIATFKTSSSDPYVQLIPLEGLASQGYFVGRKKDGKTTVMRFKRATECAVETVWEFQDAVSLSSSAPDVQLNVVYSRKMHCSPVLLIAQVEPTSLASPSILTLAWPAFPSTRLPSIVFKGPLFPFQRRTTAAS